MIKLKDFIKVSVEQLANKNQFVINYEDNETPFASRRCFRVFQSYKTIIAMYNPYTKELYINWLKWDYSKTTSKHLKMFINGYTKYTYENKQQFLNFIKQGEMVYLFEE